MTLRIIMLKWLPLVKTTLLNLQCGEVLCYGRFYKWHFTSVNPKEIQTDCLKEIVQWSRKRLLWRSQNDFSELTVHVFCWIIWWAAIIYCISTLKSTSKLLIKAYRENFYIEINYNFVFNMQVWQENHWRNYKVLMGKYLESANWHKLIFY